MALTRLTSANAIPDDSVANVKMANIVQSKNILINGDMQIAQRATSTASITSSGYHTIDRWQTSITNLGTWTQSQDTDVPSGYGFAKSLKMDCTTADASPAAADALYIRQIIEGQNVQYLKYGTSSAQSLTVSFWVKAVKTGTNIVELYNNDAVKFISKSYTISSSNTWEKKTLTFAGDTGSGDGFDNDNAASLYLHFYFGSGTDYTSGTLNTSWVEASGNQTGRAVGQVNHADSTSNNFWITGVQLEAGDTASEFEFLPYDLNLDRCHRYYQNYIAQNDKFITMGGYNSTNFIYMWFRFYKTMRVNPSLVINTGTDYYTVYRAGGTDGIDSLAVSTNTPQGCMLYKSGESGTAGDVAFLYTNNSDVYIAFDGEL